MSVKILFLFITDHYSLCLSVYLLRGIWDVLRPGDQSCSDHFGMSFDPDEDLGGLIGFRHSKRADVEADERAGPMLSATTLQSPLFPPQWDKGLPSRILVQPGSQNLSKQHSHSPLSYERHDSRSQESEGASQPKQKWSTETSLVVQWLRLSAPNAGGLGLTPGQGTRSCMLQQRSHLPQLRPRAAK